MKFKFSNQAIGAIMLALQKGIMEQVDITRMLKEFNIVDSADGLIVDNPPVLEFKDNNKTEATKKKKTTARKKKTDA